MPTGRHLSRKNKLIVALGASVAIILGVLVSTGTFEQKSEPAVTGNEPAGVPAPGMPFLEPEPTDTVVTGAIDTVGTGKGQDELYLQQRGEVKTKLILDEHSYCNAGSGGLPCMAMSISFSTAFGGKKALVDGTQQGDSILVRRLRILDDNETPRVMPAGTVYIPWARATDMILNCEVKSLMQNHEGLVFMVTKEDKKYTAVESVIDDVFRVANESTAKCGNVQLGTE